MRGRLRLGVRQTQYLKFHWKASSSAPAGVVPRQDHSYFRALHYAHEIANLFPMLFKGNFENRSNAMVGGEHFSRQTVVFRSQEFSDTFARPYGLDSARDDKPRYFGYPRRRER